MRTPASVANLRAAILSPSSRDARRGFGPTKSDSARFPQASAKSAVFRKKPVAGVDQRRPRSLYREVETISFDVQDRPQPALFPARRPEYASSALKRCRLKSIFFHE